MEPGNNEWNYYTKNDIEHGQLVFEDISSFEMIPNLLINDEFYGIDLIEENDGEYCFKVQGSHIEDNGEYKDITAMIKCKTFYIFDPKNGEKIEKTLDISPFIV